MEWVKIPISEWLETEQEIIDAFSYLLTKDKVSYDTETTGLITFKDRPLLLSFSDGVRRFGCDAEWLFHPLVRELLESPTIIKILTNAKFDMHMTENAGVRLKGPIYCTVVMDYLLDENRKGRHGLKDTARDYCGITMREFKEVFPMNRKRKGFPDDTPEDAIKRKMSTPEGAKDAKEYSGLDAYATFKVFEYLEVELKKIQMFEGITLWEYFTKIASPFTNVLYNMERRGITVCSGYFKAQEVPMQKAILELEHQFNHEANQVINLDSPPQLRKFFYEVRGKTPTKWTSGGASGNKQPATDAEVLEGWAEEGDPFAEMVVRHRKLTKIRDTYVTGLQGLVDNNFRLHTTFNQSGTVTGRLSSSEPNLQNTPRPDNDKFKLRDGFIATPGKRLIVADYGQLEMRIMAHKAQDPIMVKAICEGKDLHCLAVSLIFGSPYEEVIAAKKAEKKGIATSAQRHLLDLRQAMKSVGFGIIYGIGPFKLAAQLTEEFKKSDKTRFVSESEAEGYIDAWYGLFKTVKQYVEWQKRYVRDHGYVQTFLGRYRRLPEIKSARYKDKLKAERQAVNIVQGDAADIVNTAMLAVENDPTLEGIYELLLQVHDELVGECEDEDERVNTCLLTVKDHMEHSFERMFYKLSVPLDVEINSGYTWAQAK